MMNLSFRNTYSGVTTRYKYFQPLVYLAIKSFPERLHHVNASLILNMALRDHIINRRFSEVENKLINIHILDMDIGLCIIPREKFIEVREPSKDYDAKISLMLHSAIDILCQRSDPDTLFFNRQLTITGNTEVSHTLKNILDSIDVDELLPEWLKKITSMCHKGEMGESLP